MTPCFVGLHDLGLGSLLFRSGVLRSGIGGFCDDGLIFFCGENWGRWDWIERFAVAEIFLRFSNGNEEKGKMVLGIDV
jgi:hypothetical protein